MGVDWISLLVTCYQQTVTSTEIACKPDASTPTDDDLVHVVGVAHRLGIRVMLKPHIDLSGDPGHWRGQIQFGEDEQAWRAWFGAYARLIGHYAALAERTGVDLFAVGTELEGASHRANDWRSVVAAVRRVYSGPVTYASNWTEIGRVSWWDALDLIGIDAYYPLTDKDHPSPADLRAAWSSIVSDLDTLSRKWGRRILFTEIGYRSVNGANREPYNFQRSGVVDLQEQADCYQAALEFMTEQEWFDGFFWWNWTPNPDQGGTLDADYTANGKPAADVLRTFYTRP
jgi:hypothetical protein